MDRHLLDIVLCPACGGALRLEDDVVVTVEYTSGPRQDVESGVAACECGQRYPVTDFVLSFAGQYPPDLQREAAFWDRYYMWLLEHGSAGFHDLRQGQAPYITSGVTEPFPEAATIDRYDVHHQIAEHPLLRKGRALLDIGVGLGWTTLYFARAGYDVTAFEPSLGPVKAAKRYSMEQGVFVEYICGALGKMAFRPDSFDNVTAFHSLHHVPDLEAELRQVRLWLREGGALALDEHVGNSRLAASLAGEVHAWAEAEVLPRYRTLPAEALATLPTEPHSAREDTSVHEVEPLVSRLFAVRYSHPRHVFLDHYPLLYYLHKDRDLEGYKHALDIANQMQEFVRRVDPEGGDYITMIAENTREDQPVDDIPQAVSPVQEPAAPPGGVEAAPGEDPAARRIEELESRLREQGSWALGFEGQLREKNAELARLRGHVRRLESGRVMRLLRAINFRKR